ncbi:MAG: DUF2867 domain-containing protein [Dehalococcoidia bacterium]
MSESTPNELVLLTGATGYIGGRLLSLLEHDGIAVRALARHPENVQRREGSRTEFVQGDVADRDSLKRAMTGVTTAFYLVHSMASTRDFQRRDRTAALNFAAAAREAGVRRIIYLGGLGRGDDLSPHLASRQEVGEILRLSGVPTLELRASVVIGSGSLSFEMIRGLVDRLPVMITPRWVRIRTQPIAIEDVLAYLRAALDLPLTESRVVEIGGAEATTYGELMMEYAHQRGLRRWMIPVPVLTPHLSSLWLGLVTPLYARVGRQLIESLKHETVVEDDSARILPVKPMGVHRAVERALLNEDLDFAATRWSDALSSGETHGFGGETYGSRLVDSRVIEVRCPPEVAFAAVEALGGDTGWHAGNLLWRIRGFLDLLVGGPGLRRGRRHPRLVAVGQTLDFWRVEGLERGRLLRLRAEMRLPGRAWLQFEVEPLDEDRSQIRQTALFDPAGLAGLAYWYALFPIHSYVFQGLLEGIGSAAVASLQGGQPAPVTTASSPDTPLG